MKQMTKKAIRALLGRFDYQIGRIPAHCDYPQGNLEAFCRHLKRVGFEPRQIIDVGANRGLWSTDVRKVFGQARFTLVEPQVEMRPFLDKFCAESPGSQWILAGAAATNGEMALTVCDESTASTFTLTPEEAKALKLEQRIVPVFTLDRISSEFVGSIPEMVKLDAEGLESEIIRGGRR